MSGRVGEAGTCAVVVVTADHMIIVDSITGHVTCYICSHAGHMTYQS